MISPAPSTWHSSPVGAYLLARRRREIILSLLMATFRLPHSFKPMSKPESCSLRYSSTQYCTILRSCVGLNMPSMPEPCLEVPSAMRFLSMTVMSRHPRWVRW